MPYPVIKAVHFIGLALLLGGPVFAHIIWRERGAARPAPMSRAGWALFGLGLVLFLVSGYLDLVRAATALWGELYPGDVTEFLLQSRYGHVVLRKSALALTFASVVVMRPASVVGRGALVVLGGAIIYHISSAAHSASNGTLAFIADLVHVAALSVWGGGLFHFAVAAWPRTNGDTPERGDAAEPGDAAAASLAAASRRFAVIGTVAVVALTVTGILMASRLIYGVPALSGTPYGMALLRKVGVFVVLLGIAAANHFYFVPGLERGLDGARIVRLFRRAVRVEAVLLLLILAGTGVLTTQAPPKEPQALPAPMQQPGVVAAPGVVPGDAIHYELHLVPNTTGQLAFELHVTDADGRPVTVEPPFMDLTMPDHLMPPYYATLRPAGAGVYRTDLILPMSGFWRIFIEMEAADAAGDRQRLDDIVVEFKTAKSPREQQLVWYVSHYRVTRNALGVVVFLTWSGLLALGIFGLRTARRVGGYKPLLVASGLLLAFSSWQVGSMFVAKSWPTEHKPNPVPVSAHAIAHGEHLFMQNCAMCHGEGAQGNGPLRETMWPPPSDLTIYTSWHADGELYWFITKGVAGTDMPAFERTLSDEDRWSIIHFLRTLPPREGPYADWYPGHRQYFLDEQHLRND